MENDDMKRSAPWLSLALVGLLSGFGHNVSEAATMGSHYPFGGEGVLAATAPPPGFHYRMYNTWYNPTTLKDDSGNKQNIGFDLDLFATVHRFVYVSDKKILGADLLCDVIIPLTDKDLSIAAAGVKDSHSLAVGDIIFEPFALSWHKARWDATAAIAVIAPTGDYDATSAVNPGLGYWSGMLTLGATYYLDEQKIWSASALTRTLINSEQDDTKVTPGSEFVVEYGLGKDIKVNDSVILRPGLAGSSYWQISDDSDDGPGTVADQRKQAHALGVEINMFYLPQLIQVNLRALKEFKAENTTEGSQIVLTLTKSW